LEISLKSFYSRIFRGRPGLFIKLLKKFFKQSKVYFNMDLVDGRNRIKALKLKEKQLKALMDPFRLKLLSELTEEHYSSELAKKFKMSEQKLHYHMKLLEESGLIVKVKDESKRGALAHIYRSKANAFGLILPGAVGETRGPEILDFVTDALMVVGSPDPHGAYKARARDNYYAGELGLFLGKFSQSIQVRTDTELRPDDRKHNLILIGGPIVNTLTSEINDQLDIRFTTENGTVIHSKKTGKSYYDDEIGLIAITQNPWDPEKKIIVFAGKGYKGTKSAIVAFSKHLEKIRDTHVVLGLDIDGDGIIDDAEFLE
jgi:DNA-binding transcriptional ArsR family regulator